MTKPALARSKRINRYNSTRIYEIDNKEYPSVTSIIGMMEKPALVPWAAKMAAQYAVANHEAVGLLPAADAITLISRNWRTMRDTAADFGTEIHAYLERGETPQTHPAFDYVMSAQGYLTEHTSDVVAKEVTLLNKPAGYAGTADLLVRANGDLIVADWKTGKGLYESAAMQLVALANATHIATDKGDLIPVEHKPTMGHAVRLHPEGYELKTIDMGSETAHYLYQAFIGLTDVWTMKINDTYWDNESR